MSASVIYTKRDELGGESNVHKNSMNHANYHAVRENGSYSWGTNEHYQKLYPRGRAYYRLWDIQFARTFGETENNP